MMLLINKLLLKMAGGLWRWIVVILGLKLLTLAGVALFSQVLSDFLGAMAEAPEPVPLIRGALGWAFLAALMVLAGELLVGEAEYHCTAKARLSLRKQLFAKMLLLDVGNIERIGMSQAVSVVVDGVESMQIYYSKYLPGLLYCFAAPVYLFFRLKDVSLGSAALLLVLSLGLLPANNLFRAALSGAGANVWDSFRELTGYYLESLQGLGAFKLFNQDAERERQLRGRAHQFNLHSMEMMKSNFSSFLFSDSYIYGAVFLSLALVCWQLVRGRAALGDAIMVLMLGYGFFSSIRQLMNSAHQALMGVAAAKAVADILDIDTARPSIAFDGMVREESLPGIFVQGVSYTYPGRTRVIRNLSMRALKGRVTALVGPSGSGKSTIAALLLRFFDPSQGSIVIDGVPYLAQSPEELRRKIVMVPQQVGVFSGSLAENLRIAAPGAGDEELREVLRMALLEDWLNTLSGGLYTDVGDAGAKLSGGQKQKLGIARALLSKTPYIIFDEATSNVDPDSERDIWACIAELAQTRSLLVISHRLSTIKDADAIYVLAEGEIAETGTHEELLGKQGLYYNLVQEQAALEERNHGGPRKELVL
jgi:ATP-binding cassette subfamily C protein